MELGATVCTPVAPSCVHCPVERFCLARAAGEEREMPISSRPRSPRAVSVVFGLVTANGRVLLVRRPKGKLLGGLWALPGGERQRTSESGGLQGMIPSQARIEGRLRPRWSPVD